MLVVGVDENGLGPRLGPLVATAVTLSLPQYERVRLHRIGARLGIDDSKQTSSFGKMEHAEGFALALIEQVHGILPRHVDELFDVLALGGLSELRGRCPKDSAAQCWSHAITLPVFGGDVEQGRRSLARLARHDVQISSLQSAIACAGKVNEEMRRVGSRTSIDLALFERLVIDARDRTHEDLTAILGMVGGIRDYLAYFEHLRDRQPTLLERDRRGATYQVPGIGTLSFEIDADARHLPVAIASMVGKYVRELAMERQNRFYIGHLGELTPPSGYHDPVTRRFVNESKSLRVRLGITDDCFER